MKRESWVAFLEAVLQIKYHSSSFLPQQDEYASYWPSCFLKYNLIGNDCFNHFLTMTDSIGKCVWLQNTDFPMPYVVKGEVYSNSHSESNKNRNILVFYVTITLFIIAYCTNQICILNSTFASKTRSHTLKLHHIVISWVTF